MTSMSSWQFQTSAPRHQGGARGPARTRTRTGVCRSRPRIATFPFSILVDFEEFVERRRAGKFRRLREILPPSRGEPVSLFFASWKAKATPSIAATSSSPRVAKGVAVTGVDYPAGHRTPSNIPSSNRPCLRTWHRPNQIKAREPVNNARTTDSSNSTDSILLRIAAAAEDVPER